jgi:fatty acid desaturase
MATVAHERLARTESLTRLLSGSGVFVALAAIHGVALLAVPSIAVIAIGLWWNANTISHNFIHRPFFRLPAANRAFSAYLSVILGIPQSLWRARHLAHHSRAKTFRNTPSVLIETALVVTLWAALLLIAPHFFVTVYAPGYLLGLGLCHLQGHFEHVRGTTSHYGWVYNTLFFNDGYHVEHHQRPGEDWRRLPQLARADAPRSRWPAVLRWLEWFDLTSLERLVLSSAALQRFVLAAHQRAFRALAPRLPPVARVTIVGGGLFPRTALIVRRLLPDASIHIVDANDAHLAIARPFLDERVTFQQASYDPTVLGDDRTDLLVIPLAFVGDRRRLYDRAPAPAVLVHDWVWHRHSPGVTVSWLLLKRLNLVLR